jgi:hypothetical protein
VRGWVRRSWGIGLDRGMKGAGGEGCGGQTRRKGKGARKSEEFWSR